MPRVYFTIGPSKTPLYGSRATDCPTSMVFTRMRKILLVLIRLYKRFISPHKGFVCAYRVHTGRCSCSSLGYRAIKLRGVISGLAILRKRTYLCGLAHRSQIPAARPLPAQRGDCDPGCDAPCDLNYAPSDCCDVGGCDWPGKTWKNRRQWEKHGYIPPFRPKPR